MEIIIFCNTLPSRYSRHHEEAGSSQMGQRATSCQILRRVASALTEKAVGGFIPPDAGTYQAQQEKGSHGADTGLSGNLSPFRVKCYSEPAISYPLGTPATMSGQS